VAEGVGWGVDVAPRRMNESDRGRTAFYRKFWKVDVEDPKLYDLTVDTSRLKFELAAEVVAAAARIKSAVPAGA
jgi:cytidylate kinase